MFGVGYGAGFGKAGLVGVAVSYTVDELRKLLQNVKNACVYNESY